MYCESWTKKEAVFIANHDDVRLLNFIIDIKLLPQSPDPKNVIIKYKRGKKEKVWKMKWEKFLEQTSLGTIALIPRINFEFKEIGVLTTS
jgi:hypothetical protein